ncbi:prolipoprotein diacylglyceryl transferase [Mycolicibacterium sp. S3B2]|uniref:prolipoprotein diacylglyceryl transferase n=1 Tax=Mycolicibacterium sp. S3B2 TaxID=3415120 RepID=UPI003C79CC80
MTTTVLAYIPSPAQGVWQIGPVPLRAYALFIIAGIIAALLIGDRRWVARGGEPGVIYDVVLWAVPFGLIGGRLYHVITDWPKYFGEGGAGLVGALRIWDGGLGIWGAVALGGVGAWIACRRLGIPLPAFGDAIAPGIILAQAIGRLGNYFNQELYGRETTLPWGLEIYERRNAAGVLDNLNGVSTGELVTIVHPTFLYELLWNLLVFAALIVIDRRWRIGHGRLFAMYVAGYCLGRFWIELMRADQAQLLAGIRVNSFTSTFVFIGAVVYIMAAPKGREAPETLRGTHDGEAGVEAVVKDVAVASGAGVVAAAKAADVDERAEDRVEEVPAADQGGGAPPPGDAATQIEVESGAENDADADVDPDAELGAQLAHAAEAMQAELDRRAEELSSVESGGVAAAAEEAPQVTDAVDVEGEAAPADHVERSSPSFQFPPFDAAADAELGAQLAHAAEAMTAESAGREEAAPTEPEAGDAGPEAGLGSVEGDEVAAASDEASEVHEAAVEGEAEAGELVEEVAEESDAGEAEQLAEAAESVTGDAGPEAGLGSVEGDEVAAASDEASEVHEAAVEGEAEAGELVEEVAEESDAGEAEQLAEAAESVTAVAEPEAEAAESVTGGAEPGAGLGSVEGDEVAAASDEASEVHEAAVEGGAEAGELAEEVASESDAGDAEQLAGAAESVSGGAEPGAGLGSVEGDEVAAATDEASDAHDVAAAGKAEASKLADESGSASNRPSVAVPPQLGGRVRHWLRRRRNR